MDDLYGLFTHTPAAWGWPRTQKETWRFLKKINTGNLMSGIIAGILADKILNL
jgi:hypothetical protein